MQLPASVLEDIRATIASGYYERLAPARRERKSLCESLERELGEGRLPLILEVATARPPAGLLVPNRAEAEALMERLASLAPAAMSLWVEPRHMAGDLRWLARERPFPVVARDLVIDPRQIVGGDAVVLSRALLALAGCEAHPLIEAAHELDMEAVLEVRTAEDMAYARASEADVIAIKNWGANGHVPGSGRLPNVRGPDIYNSLSILSAHRTSRPVISCSGIRTPAQARALISAGAAGVEVDAETTSGEDCALIVEALKKAMGGKGPAKKKEGGS